MTKKKLSMIIAVIGLILIAVGVMILFIPSASKSSSNKQDNNNGEEDAVKGAVEIDTPQEVIDSTKKNNNDKVYEMHEYSNQEYTIISITGSSEVAIKVSVKNKGGVIKKGWIKFEFDVNGKTYNEFMYHDEIKANSEYELYIQSYETEILNATDYKIGELTSDELTEMNKTLSE